MKQGLSLLNFRGARRLPVIRQSEATECGLACLAMIAAYHGHRIDLGSLRLRHPVSLLGANLKTLIATAQDLGLTSRPLRVELGAVTRLQTPCILHWNLNHFVVLKSVARNSYKIHDPARGERRCSRTEVSSAFTGVALELQPGAGFRRADERLQMRLTDMWSRITGLGQALAQMLALSVIMQLFVLVAPFYMQLVVDEVLTRYDTELLAILALGFCLFMLIDVAATALRSYVILTIGNLLGFQMVSNLLRHLLRLPLQWYEKRHVGDILSRFSSTRPIRDLFTEGLVATVIDGAMAISTLVLIFVYSQLLGFVIVAAVMSYLALRASLYRPLRRRLEDQLVARAEEQSTFIESIRGIQSIRIFGHEALRHSIWQNRHADVINSGVRIGKLQIGFEAANRLLFGLENTLVVYLGALAIIEGTMTIGMLFAFMAYKRQFVDKASTLVERLIELRLLGLHLERIADIGLARPEDAHTRAPIVTPAAAERGRIEIRDVSFRYSAHEPWIIRHASLTIRQGEMISIAGPSGAGKTTLMKLLLGLFECTRGDITYEGQPLPQLGYRAFRRCIGTVMQDDALFAGSIAENISFFDLQPDLEKIRSCAEMAAIHADITAMPMGYDSLVGDMGDALSAGQRQRVLLARALYREPDILILDEGTANLDATTETAVVQMLRDLPATRLCVAHRQRLLRASGRVVALRDGGLYELGYNGAGEHRKSV